jgi:hypothetical protein
MRFRRIFTGKHTNEMKRKQLIRLTESDLHRIIQEALDEIGDSHYGQYQLGRASSRALGRGDVWTAYEADKRKNDMDDYYRGHTNQFNADHAMNRDERNATSNKLGLGQVYSRFKDRMRVR